MAKACLTTSVPPDSTMLKVSRPASGVLVVSQGRTQAFVRLAIWISVVVIFYLVVLGDGAQTAARAGSDIAPDWHVWVLLLVPLCLLPYLFGLIRTMSRADELMFDGRGRTIYKGKRALATFAEIRSLELRAVHGTCEEFRLSAVLADGENVELIETEASAVIEALAGEISALLNISLIRKA